MFSSQVRTYKSVLSMGKTSPIYQFARLQLWWCRYEASMEEPDLDKGGSPLMHAANCGHAAAVTALIEVRALLL